jgi:hypothetical protein
MNGLPRSVPAGLSEQKNPLSLLCKRSAAYPERGDARIVVMKGSFENLGRFRFAETPA